MPGWDNDVAYCSGIDTRGVSPIVNQMNSDGKLLIASGVAPYIRANHLSVGSGMSIVNGSGSIALDSKIQYIRKVMTSSDIKNLVASPFEIIPAPGANSVIAPIYFTAKFVYAGNDQFTDGATLKVKYISTFSIDALMTAFSINGVDNMYSILPVISSMIDLTLADVEDKSIIITTDGVEYAGNASNDNYIIVQALYWVSKLI